MRPTRLPSRQHAGQAGKRDPDHVLAMHWLACRVTVAVERDERDIRVSIPLCRALLKPRAERAAKRAAA